MDDPIAMMELMVFVTAFIVIVNLVFLISSHFFGKK